MKLIITILVILIFSNLQAKTKNHRKHASEIKEHKVISLSDLKVKATPSKKFNINHDKKFEPAVIKLEGVSVYAN